MWGACPKTKFDAVSTTRYREESSGIIQHGVCRNRKAGVFGQPVGGKNE